MQPMPQEIHVRLFDRDGEVYADCSRCDLMATGANDAEAIEILSQALIVYYAGRLLGLPEGSANPRNRLLRIAYPSGERDRFVFVPEPNEQAVAEHAERLREMLERMRQSPS